MSEWSDKNDRIFPEIAIIDATYKDKWFVHRVIRFLHDHPERAPDYIDFVGDDWETRNIDNESKHECASSFSNNCM